MKLVDGVRDSWRWLTMQIGAALVIVPPAWISLTKSQQDAIIGLLPGAITRNLETWQALVALGAAIMVARVIKQGSPSK